MTDATHTICRKTAKQKCYPPDGYVMIQLTIGKYLEIQWESHISTENKASAEKSIKPETIH